MTKIAWIGLLAMTLAACSGRTKTLRTETPAATPAAPRTYTYRVIESYPHSTDSYTQGLLFADGVMWEGTGEYGHSRLQRIDLETGRTDAAPQRIRRRHRAARRQDLPTDLGKQQSLRL